MPSGGSWLTRFERFDSYHALIRTLPRRQLLPLWVAVFSTFSMTGFVMDLFLLGRQPLPMLALNAVVSGAATVVAGLVSLARRGRPVGYAVVVATYLGILLLALGSFTLLPAMPPGRLTIDGYGIMLTVTVGYIYFLIFIDQTSARYLRVQTEMALARDIHRVLVPAIQHTIGDHEFFGWSVPSGDVGGDLVDLVETGDGWLGYVADVSGHGVGAGVVMGMFKSSIRTRARDGGSIGALLGDVHQVLMPLKQPQMYVTAACVRGGSDGIVDCAVAGHLPILRVRDGVVEEVTSPQLAIGMLHDTTFTSCRVDSRPGDLFAVLTDGLVEVFDTEREELGTGARAHGAQLDDQTLLLIRHA